MATASPMVTAGLKLAAGDVTEGERPAQHGQPSGEGDPNEADAHLYLLLGQEQRRQHRSATNAEDQPERAEKLRASRAPRDGSRMYDSLLGM
jgi:hypothetical protein